MSSFLSIIWANLSQIYFANLNFKNSDLANSYIIQAEKSNITIKNCVFANISCGNKEIFVLKTIFKILLMNSLFEVIFIINFNYLIF